MNSKVLLVDDEKDIVDLMEEVLRQDGFQNIQKAYTGMDALEMCREFQPDVIVLDIMLPDIDGIEVCKKYVNFQYVLFFFFHQGMMILIKYLGCQVVEMII